VVTQSAKAAELHSTTGKRGFYYSLLLHAESGKKNPTKKKKKHRHEIFWTPAPTLCVTSQVPDLHNPHQAQVNIV